MPRIRRTNNNFTAGEISPDLHERYDYDKYSSALATLQNFIPQPQGGAKRRPGTRFVAQAKNATATRLIPFIFGNSDAAVVEVGDNYFRFFANEAQTQIVGVPVEVVSPYSQGQIREFQFAQSADTMFMVHGAISPRQLVRLAVDQWQVRTTLFTPPPSFEKGRDGNLTMSLSATSGAGVTVSVSTPFFLPSDKDRLLTEIRQLGNGEAVIVTVTDSMNIVVDITTVFSALLYDPFTWSLSGSPVARLSIDKAAPVGAQVKLIAQREQLAMPNLVTNGTFASAASWNNLSSRVLGTGTADSGSDTAMVDAAATFISWGVEPGHRAVNETDGIEDAVASVTGETSILTTTDGSVWAAGKVYTMRETGTALFLNGHVDLAGGINGVGAIEQQIAVVDDDIYQLKFTVSNASLSMQIGTASLKSDILPEATFEIGEHEVTFTADTTAAFLSFRNNQDQTATLDDVSVRLFNIEAWRTDDVGRFVRMNTGIVEITAFVGPSVVTGIIRKELSDDEDALEGAWSLEDSRWSAARGWPECITFHGQRLIHAATRSDPQRIWGSVPGIPLDFGTGADAADAIEFEIAATEKNRIHWVHGEKTLIAGTQREEYSIRGELGHTLTPSGIDVSSPTHIGSIKHQPHRTPDSLIFINRSGTRLYENTGTDDFTGDDRAITDLSILAEHLAGRGIRSFAFQQEPRPILWVVLLDNTLHAVTYNRAQKVIAWAPQPMTGLVLDVCVIPHPDGERDQVWILIDRGISAGVPSVEYLEDLRGFYDQLMLDSAVVLTGHTGATVDVPHLDGLTVGILGDGAAQPAQVVTGGSITLDPEAAMVEVGLQFTPTLVTLRPTLDKEPVTGLFVSNSRVQISLKDTINAVVNDERIDFTTTSQVLDAPPDLFTGIKEINTAGWDTDATITIVQDMPYPIYVRGIFRALEVEQP